MWVLLMERKANKLILPCIQVLKPACEAALRRIFKLCDVDKNGILDAAELNEFQRKCFDSPLQTQELEGIQDMVRQHGDGGVAIVEVEPLDKTRSSPSSTASSFSSLSSRASTPESSINHPSQRATKTGGTPSLSQSQITGLTELGFLYLHTVFIQRGRLETTWTVLRKFGYAEDLRLTEDFLAPKFDVPHGCSVELSQKGYEFLTSLFVGFDKVRNVLHCGSASLRRNFGQISRIGMVLLTLSNYQISSKHHLEIHGRVRVFLIRPSRTSRVP